MGGLTVEGISHDWGARCALDDVSFSVEPGRFCALLGPNGAGKSTLFGMLTRLFTPRAGRIVMAGFDMARAPRAALARMGAVFQASTLDPDLTVRHNLLYFAALHGLSGREAEMRTIAALERLGMAERAGEKVAKLNGGHRRRMEIARALLHRPQVLLLDEPTVGLDAAARTAITAHVHDLSADGLTVLWATHLVDEVRKTDRLVILHRGSVLADGEAGEIGGADLTARFLALTGERA
ncbi:MULTISPECIES: ABC transporter ATP-binding protein [unclassified Shinella]|jgi:ABC-2 type transport system ATP-binding protein|uniref:ABC transporter ATP-binding protein n=1 Tax=unclassified Shinella TaxID=2643062 RepID=UPI00234EA74B|nr:MULTISPECIES: ABC transporter ATP-binding protein [unclassified Shinella]MCO5151911.1 ATP-binding cassette domain-containing protein [Shinella sp.]MDC7265513.1 ATP-binding cassette domain-containing protein [Shinella sp. HY16]MDC7272410.1 ATP-binding cassette domain-containing protein [Shinella sp. YZ44]